MQDTLVQRLRDRAYSFKIPDPLVEEAANEIERLREAIRRFSEQDATLSVQGGNVTVEMDATLTDAEREAIQTAMNAYGENNDDRECEMIEATLRRLLERTK